MAKTRKKVNRGKHHARVVAVRKKMAKEARDAVRVAARAEGGEKNDRQV